MGKLKLFGQVTDKILPTIRLGKINVCSALLLLWAAKAQSADYALGQEVADDIDETAMDLFAQAPQLIGWHSDISTTMRKCFGSETLIPVPEKVLDAAPPLVSDRGDLTIVALDGPNGSGKTTLISHLLADNRANTLGISKVPREASAGNFTHSLLVGQFKPESTHAMYWNALTECFITSSALYDHFLNDFPNQGIAMLDRGEASHYAYEGYNLLLEYPELSTNQIFEYISLLLRFYRHNDLSFFLATSEKTIKKRLGDLNSEFAAALPVVTALYEEYNKAHPATLTLSTDSKRPADLSEEIMAYLQKIKGPII